MKKLIKFAVSGLPALLPVMAFAQTYTSLTVTSPVTSIGGFIGLICTAINWLFTFLIVLAVLFVLLAAFKYLTASGDPEKVKGASHQLIYAAVAVAVAVLAKGIPLIVGSFLGASGLKSC
ncbi:MAG: hypothetical protein KGJ89_01600 [Patescibacteria group bacterium]|nr:hypothetical protein [Patescibacteria group bacterium]MDE2015204.1 hypothetical protein [Patescibacteria group bacterium]MDE2226631.1 hypothetical protein [Patescibacteria group bacterium]